PWRRRRGSTRPRRSCRAAPPSWRARRSLRIRLVGCREQDPLVAVEARAGAGVTCRSDLLDLEQDHVTVAAERRASLMLAVPRGVALGPVLLSAAGPVGGAALGERAAQGLVVHPREHEHLAGGVVLHDGGGESAGAEAHARDSQREV